MCARCLGGFLLQSLPGAKVLFHAMSRLTQASTLEEPVLLTSAGCPLTAGTRWTGTLAASADGSFLRVRCPALPADNNWWSDHGHQVDKGFHPHPHSPRCRPCHSNLTDDDILTDYKPPVGCPCTPYLLCLNDLQLGFNAW